MRIIKHLSYVLMWAASFVVGFGAGLSVKVFIVRGAPVIHGGGELALLLAIPACIFAGYRLGMGGVKIRKQRGRLLDESTEHSD